MKKLIYYGIGIFSIVLCGIFLWFGTRTERAISKINEEYFDLSLNLEEKTATYSGEKLELTELFGISDKELEEMIANGSFQAFLEEQLVGDVEYGEEKVTISNPYSTRSLLVRTKEKAVFDEYDTIISAEALTDDLYLVKYDSAAETKTGYQDLLKDESISGVQKNKSVHIMEEAEPQSVSGENLSWGVAATGLDSYKAKLNYEGAGRKVTVAVVDTGVRMTHEAFAMEQTADKLDLTYAYDYANDDEDPTDDGGHGTMVAGVIAQSTPDNVKIVPVKVLDSKGNGDFHQIFEVLLDLSGKVDVVNLSLGSEAKWFTEEDKAIFNDVFDKIYENGTLVVCSAGNSATDVCYPAACRSTLASSAVDQNKKFAEFSCYGEEVDFATPGVAITMPAYTGDSDYRTTNGTSFSCPFLAAAVATVKADYGYTEIPKLIDVLKANAEDLGTPGKDDYYGYGNIDFNLVMFQNPVIADLKLTSSENTNQIAVKAVSGSPMVSYAVTRTGAQPDHWTALAEPTKQLEMEVPVTENGEHFIWIKDEKGNFSSKSILVSGLESGGQVQVENHTNGKASVTIGNVKSEEGDFSTPVETGRLVISCDRPVVVTLIEEDKGEISTKLEYTRINKDGDYEYDFEIDDVKFVIEI